MARSAPSSATRSAMRSTSRGVATTAPALRSSGGPTSMRTSFRQRAQLLVDQFNGYAGAFNQRVNGEITLAENIGDLAGLAVAVRAYRMSLQGKAAPVIDGFTGEQRLFIRWAQLWRTLTRDEYLRQTMLTNHHAPARTPRQRSRRQSGRVSCGVRRPAGRQALPGSEKARSNLVASHRLVEAAFSLRSRPLQAACQTLKYGDTR